ncbi:hypothetical protein JI664_01720 [Rhodobacter sp. NTK016B]|uniref:hypothetical protein n=1 Tax=Rhodobacter sp. NTK016B TaxID=2759676 RepID=UPI001A9042C9|nr:hypothetical protein [Rhodobacter sp. NTK016B]MBN8290671.1 hypothetical protein [Rhodobacter sp. NTK016B]
MSIFRKSLHLAAANFRRVRLIGASVLGAGLLAAGLTATPAAAQDGTTTIPDTSTNAVYEVGWMRWIQYWTDSALYSGGVGLRNRGYGAIEISGIPSGATVRNGYLYWNIITSGTPGPGQRILYIQRLYPNRSGFYRVTGTQVGQGSTPCWGGTYNTVYRAWVGRNIITGNGTYGLTVPAWAFGRTDGSLPWGNVVHPSINGASLFVITTGDRYVSLYDRPMAGQMFYSYDGLSVNAASPWAARNSYSTILHFAQSDGQYGNPGLTLSSAVADESVQVNGTYISGPLSTRRTDGDWNGDAGGSYAQLWDHVVHDVSDLVDSGDTYVAIQHAGETGSSDCLVPVALGMERY